MKKYIITSVLILTVLFTRISKADAGTLFPTHVPGETMYSLQEIYDLATASTTASIGNGLPFNRPASVNGSMVTLEELYNAVLALRNASSTTGGGDDGGGIVIKDNIAQINPNSDSRDAGFLKVEENQTSDEYDILAFEIDVDVDSSNLVILEIPIELNIENVSTTDLDVTTLVNDLWIEVDGEIYDDYDFVGTTTIASGNNLAITAVFTIDEGDLQITAGDVANAVVFVEFNEQEGNYSEGTTIKASVRGADIDAENTEGDVFDLTGTVTGEVQILKILTATIENFEWVVSNIGTVIDFFFTVTAEDDDFSVLTSSIVDSSSGTATTSERILTKSTGDADVISGGFVVLDGDTARFRVRYTISGDNGTYSEVQITSVANYDIPDDDQVSPTATININ